MKRLAFLLVALAAFNAAAQTYPSKNVRLVNPFPPGGPLDLIGRLMSERLGAALGKPVIVENKPGAAGNIGAAEAAKSAPDGHTVFLTLYSILTSNPHLYPGLPFDPLRDFAPVTAIASFDGVLIAHPSVPAASVAELVAYAKANPGRLNYASAGKASPGHLTAEQFRVRTGALFTHVPYKGNAEAVRSVLAGETHIMFTPSTVTLPLIKSGKLKALAIYLADEIDELPGVRSVAAQGVAGLDARSIPSWYGMLVPAGTPREVVMRLNAETVKILKDPQVDKTLRTARIFPIANSPEEFGALIRDSHEAWGRVIRETGVKGE
jgi:tripartite-type tricarboxylate transporter receptor subunit TctC